MHIKEMVLRLSIKRSLKQQKVHHKKQTASDRILIMIFKKMGFYDPTEDIKKRVNEVRPLIQHSYPLEVTKGRPTTDEAYLKKVREMIVDLEKEVIKAKEDGKP